MPTFENGEEYRWPVTREQSVPGSDAVTVPGSQAEWFEFPATSMFGTGWHFVEPAFELDMAPHQREYLGEWGNTPMVTAVDADAGTITVSNQHRSPYSPTNEDGSWRRDDRADAYRQAMADFAAGRIDPERYWEQVGQAEMAMARLRANPRVRVGGTGPALEPETDAFQMRVRSYANTVSYTPGLQWLVNYPSDSPTEMQQSRGGVWFVRDTKLEKFFDAWVQLFSNLGLAHAAAVFMLETHWNGKEFSNAQVIRSYISD